MREKLKSARALVVEEKTNKKDISYDLTRQYKTLQVHTETKIQELETIVRRLTSDLSESSLKACKECFFFLGSNGEN